MLKCMFTQGHTTTYILDIWEDQIFSVAFNFHKQMVEEGAQKCPACSQENFENHPDK